MTLNAHQEVSATDVETFVALRRDIHAHPELAFKEHRTAALVAERLRAWGYEVTEGLGGTGVLGSLRRGASKRAIGLRADMDALPLQEHSGVPWASRHDHTMHACGHDGHTATLLAAAKQLATAGTFDGTVHVIFQPAEEGGGGAVKMMADGLFERAPCDAIFAFHNMPGYEVGHFAFRAGPFMASSDDATITVHGTGGHGALPHRADDPVVAAAAIVMALQTIVSRNVDPLQTAVITVGAIHGGAANNVIPASVRMELSIRALLPEVRKTLRERIHALVRAQAESFGVRAEIDWQDGYAVLVNDAESTRLAAEVAVDLVGAERVNADAPPLTGSEDFAFMLERVPGSYLLIGNGTTDHPEPQHACMVHNPGYDFNDHILPVGANYWVALAHRFLAVR